MADPRERYEDQVEAFSVALDGRQAEVWTALPGIVQSVNWTEITCTVQPAIQAKVTDDDGTSTWVNLPLLIHVPIHFQSGGGFTATFPLAANDEVLVVFASRCIDNWWANGGVATQAELRLNDLSDGFCIPKVWSKPKAIANISTTSAQIRTDDGQAYVELAAAHAINVVTVGNVSVTTTDSGNLSANIDGTTTVHSKGNVSVQSSNGTVTLTDKAGSTVVMNGDTTGTMTFPGGLTLNGNLLVNGSIAYTEGMTGNVGGGGGVATFNGNVAVNGQTTTNTLTVT